LLEFTPLIDKIRAERQEGYVGIMKDATAAQLHEIFEKVEALHRKFRITVTFQNFGIWTRAAKQEIPTVGNSFRKLLIGSGPKHRVDILSGLTGQIKPGVLILFNFFMNVCANRRLF